MNVRFFVMATRTMLFALLILVVLFTLTACDSVEMNTGTIALPPSPTVPLPTFTPTQVAATLTPIPATYTPTSVPPTLAPTSVPPPPTKLPTPIPARPAVEISPSNGPSGTLVQVIATGFPASALVTIGLGPANSQFTEVARGTTDTTGRFVAQVPVQGAAGMNWVFGANTGGVFANSAFFHITGGNPMVAISPASGPSGTMVQVVATGFPANTLVTIGLGPANSQFTEVARGTTDTTGRFVAQAPVQGAAGMNWVFGANAGGVFANSAFFRITGGNPIGLKTYANSYFKIALQYPANWQLDPQYSDPQSGQRFVGRDGFFLIGAMDGDTIDQVTASEAYHILRPYGTQPSISSLQIQGYEARLVLPSTDQPTGILNQSLLVVRYPNPVNISGHPCQFFALYADQVHILTIAQTLRFDQS